MNNVLEMKSCVDRPTGHVLLIIRDKEGNVVERRVLGNNIVVDNMNGDEHGIYLIGGEVLAASNITKIGLGQGTDENATRTALVDPPAGAVNTAVSVKEYGTSPASVTFEATFDTSTGNGIEFTEVGLLLDSVTPDLAAVKVFDSMNKSDLFSWTFEWKLVWSI